MTWADLTAQLDQLRADADGIPSQVTDVILDIAAQRVHTRGGAGILADLGLDHDTIYHHTALEGATIADRHPLDSPHDIANLAYTRGLLVGLVLGQWAPNSQAGVTA